MGAGLRTRAASAALCILLVAASGEAWAGSDLTGAKAFMEELYPTKKTVQAGPVKARVGPKVEFRTGHPSELVSVDLTGDQLIMQTSVTAFMEKAKFNGFGFRFKGAPAISAVTIDPSSTLKVEPGRITFGAKDVYINLSNRLFTAGEVLVLDFTFAAPAR